MASSSVAIKISFGGDCEYANEENCRDTRCSCRFDKGHLSYTLPNDYVVIDLETTGLSPSVLTRRFQIGERTAM